MLPTLEIVHAQFLARVRDEARLERSDEASAGGAESPERVQSANPSPS